LLGGIFIYKERCRTKACALYPLGRIAAVNDVILNSFGVALKKILQPYSRAAANDLA
jgi:hypothetical protein